MSNEQKGATRNRGQLINPDPMGMAAELAEVLPLLAKLSWKGLQGRRDNPQLIFDQKDLHKLGIQKEQREYYYEDFQANLIMFYLNFKETCWY